jgi:hypothetical protein
MPSNVKELRAELKDLSSSFFEEDNVFRKSIIVFNFVETIIKNKEAKKSFDSLVAEAAEEINSAEIGNEENILKTKLCCGTRFWRNFADLDTVHSIMKKMRKDKDRRALKELDNIICKPYSINLFKTAFQIVGGCILEKMEQEEFLKWTDKSNKTWFDEKRSILYVKGEEIIINNQDKITNAHKILRHIFITNKDNLKDDFFYSEMAFDEFEDMEYKQDKDGWRKYFIACRDINLKIQKQTKNKISDFLNFNYGKRAKVKINEAYL